MKRLLAILTSVCLLFGLGSSAMAYEYTGEGPISDEIVTISILGGNASNTGVNAVGLPFYENLYKAAGVEPELELLDYLTYNEAVKPRLAAGTDLADIIRLPTMDSDMAYIQAGLFVDLTELFDKYGFNVKKALEAYGASEDDLRTPDGKIYYMPMLSNSTTLSHTLHLNVQWLKNLGLEQPQTIEEYYEVLKAFRDNDANGNGVPDDEIPLTVKRADYLKLMSCFWGIDLSTGFFLDGDGNVQASYTSQNYRDYLTFMHKLFVEGLLDPEFASNSTDILTNYCSQDRVGSMYGYTTDGYTMVKSNPNYVEGEPVLLAMKPLTSSFVKEGFYWGNDPINTLFGISRDCQNPEMAFKFLDYCFSGRQQWIAQDSDIALSCYHLPIALIPETEYSIIPQWMAERDQELKPYHKSALNIRYYTEEELEIIDMYNSDIETYTSENYLLFITGAKDLSEFDSYVATLESMGINEIRDVYQKHFGKN